MTEKSSTDEIRAVSGILRRRAWVIVLCMVVLPAAAYGLSMLQTKQYEAKSALLFRDPAFDQKLFGSTFMPQSRDADREAATNIRLVSLRPVAVRAAERITAEGEMRLTPGRVRKIVTVEGEGQSDVVSVTVRSPNAEFAAHLANVFAQEYIAFRQESDRKTISSAQRLVERQLAALTPTDSDAEERSASLERRAEELGILASLQTGNAELVEFAEVPVRAASPRVTRNVVLGAGLGLILGLVLAFLLERLDRRFRSPEEIEATFGRPILGLVPQIRGDKHATATAVQAEAFRMLRANLRYFSLDHEVRSVLITSAAPGDGKTTVAHNLAIRAAEAGDRVLLIEADLRRPTLAPRLGVHPRLGVSTLITGGGDLADSVERISLASLSAAASADASLDVLFAGPIPPNPMDLIESDRMRELVKNAEEDYDLVVIDTPPTSIVSDAIPLVRYVSGVIVVSRVGRSTRDAAQRLRGQLENLNAPVLGVVVNFIASGAGGYGYGYGYGYQPDDDRERLVPADADSDRTGRTEQDRVEA